MDNIGDHAIDTITRIELGRRIPGVEMVTYTPWPGRYCGNRITIDRSGAWSGEGRFDAIVIGGGAILLGPPFRDPSGQFFLLGPNPEKFQDKTPIYWNGVCSDSQNLALTKPEWKEFMVKAVDRVSYRAVRNQRTKKYLESCGVTGSIEVIPDICVAGGRSLPPRRGRKRPRIAILAGRPVFPKRFTERIGRIAMQNASLSDPRLLDMRPYEEESGFNDHAFATILKEKLVAKIRDPAEIEILAFGEMYGDDLVCESLAVQTGMRWEKLWTLGFRDILKRLAGFDLVIGFRLHACIFSFSVGTPFLAIDPYFSIDTNTSKVKEFCLQSGQGDSYFTLSELLEGSERISQAIGRRLNGEWEAMLEARVRMKDQVEKHFDKLAALIQGGANG